jgi:tRNA modification GTPase
VSRPPNWAILLTPPGAAAIAVIRIGGPAVGAFLRDHFSRAAAAGRAVHGILRDGVKEIDDPVVVLHEDGAIADINVHGGPWVITEVLDLTRRRGFEPLPANTFPLPPEAVDGADEIERLVLRYSPMAKTELALRWLLAQPGSWRRRPISARPPPPFPPALLSPPKIAIVGPANVGKSTLANHLFSQERSITADLPGTTRDWVGEIADINGLAVFLMDTPGLRQTSDPIEQAAIAASTGAIAAADLVILVVDAEASIEEQQRWVEQFPAALVVRNKCDRSNQTAPIDAVHPYVYTAATAAVGLSALRQAIVRPFIRPWRHPRRATIHAPSAA